MAKRVAPELRDIAAEIVRRAGTEIDWPYISVSDPPTAQERLQLLAAALQGITVMAVPRDVMTDEEWEARYCTRESQADHAHPQPTERL